MLAAVAFATALVTDEAPLRLDLPLCKCIMLVCPSLEVLLSELQETVNYAHLCTSRDVYPPRKDAFEIIEEPCNSKRGKMKSTHYSQYEDRPTRAMAYISTISLD